MGHFADIHSPAARARYGVINGFARPVASIASEADPLGHFIGGYHVGRYGSGMIDPSGLHVVCGTDGWARDAETGKHLWPWLTHLGGYPASTPEGFVKVLVLYDLVRLEARRWRVVEYAEWVLVAYQRAWQAVYDAAPFAAMLNPHEARMVTVRSRAGIHGPGWWEEWEEKVLGRGERGWSDARRAAEGITLPIPERQELRDAYYREEDRLIRARGWLALFDAALVIAAAHRLPPPTEAQAATDAHARLTVNGRLYLFRAMRSSPRPCGFASRGPARATSKWKWRRDHALRPPLPRPQASMLPHAGT